MKAIKASYYENIIDVKLCKSKKEDHNYKTHYLLKISIKCFQISEKFLH